jgi:CAAX protease family protein
LTGASAVSKMAECAEMPDAPGRRRRPRLGRRAEAVVFAVGVLGLAVATVNYRVLPQLFPLTPTITAASVLLISRGLDRAAWLDLGFTVLGIRAWLVAGAVPLLALGSGLVAAWFLGLTTPALPEGVSGLEYVLISLALIELSSIAAFGEELGWRGFLVPRLAGLGRVGAGLASGALWAAWHVPLYGINPNMALFTLAVIAIGFVANELRAATGSVWPAAILHGAHNAGGTITGTLVEGAPASIGSVMGTTGLVPLAIYSTIALAIVVRRRPWGPMWAASRPAFSL